MSFKNAEEYFICKSFTVGRNLMQFEDIQKKLDGMKQFDEIIYHHTESELNEALQILKQELNIQLLAKK